MRVEKRRWTKADEWLLPDGPALNAPADLVLAFGNTSAMKREDLYRSLRETYPEAHVLGCSTGGEILGQRVFDDSLVTTALQFDNTQLRIGRVPLSRAEDSADAGKQLARTLPPGELAHVLVLSDGIDVNGSGLVRGMVAHLPEGVQVTGGLAADGDRFEDTPLWADGLVEAPSVVAVGFYGRHLRVSCGAGGGWDPFGPERLITRSEGNVLYELDDYSALALYKKYLGPHADKLPASGLLFPLAIHTQENRDRGDIARTILGVDEAAQSITFAGDVPEGAYARFMKTNIERIIDGAVGAAHACGEGMNGRAAQLALLISCVGRKWVLNQRVEEEVEAAGDALGGQASLLGFYSYGEIAPSDPSSPSELHNQTMTITTFMEQ